MTASPTDRATSWQDPNADASTRLDVLIADMSLPEKVAQLGSVWLRFDVVTGEVALAIPPSGVGRLARVQFADGRRF